LRLQTSPFRHIRIVASAALGAAALALTPALAAAAPGGLDPSFGVGGIARPDTPAPQDIVVDEGGRTFMGTTVGGAAAVVALTPEGEVDERFGVAGSATVSPGEQLRVLSVALDSQGRIVLAGAAALEPFLARFTATGELDTGFGEDGVVFLPDDVREPALTVTAGDGVAVAGGQGTAFHFARLSEDGELDSSFGVDGVATVSGPPPYSPPQGYTVRAAEVAVAPDGGLVAVGRMRIYYVDAPSALMARVTASGAPDEEFGAPEQPGWLHVNGAETFVGLHVLDDGRIVAAGSDYNNSAFVLKGFTPGGELDRAFGSGGTAAVRVGSHGGNPYYNETHAIELVTQEDGRYVIGGTAGVTGTPDDKAFALARFGADGSLDQAFGQGGVSTTEFGLDTYAYTVAAAGEGRVVIGGSNADGPIVARYLTAEDPEPPDPGGGSGGVAGVAGPGVKLHKLIVPSSRAKLMRRGVRARATCAVDCRLVLEVTVKPRLAAAMGLPGGVMARSSAPAKAGRARWITAYLTPRARRALASYSGSGKLHARVIARRP
jgi:uncharacterized delta-60 repeat protein